MYIVAEYLYIENLIINYIILQITKSITKTKASKKRIIITSIILAFYPFAMFFSSLYFLSNFYIKIVISIIAIKLAFNAKSKKLYLKQLSAFYLVSFIFAGASIGIYFFNKDLNSYFLKDNKNFEVFPIKYLALGIILGGIMIKNIISYYQKKSLREKDLLDVNIQFKDKNIFTVTLVDTGNSLVEPLSKLPVFIVEYSVIKTLIPNDLREIFETDSENDYIALEKVMGKLEKDINIRLIPFKSVGLKSGILIGFKPDYIIVSHESEKKRYDDLIIGIYNGKLSVDEDYNGLLNLEIINKGELESVN